jgi:riboflavin synthase
MARGATLETARESVGSRSIEEVRSTTTEKQTRQTGTMDAHNKAVAWKEALSWPGCSCSVVLAFGCTNRKDDGSRRQAALGFQASTRHT